MNIKSYEANIASIFRYATVLLFSATISNAEATTLDEMLGAAYRHDAQIISAKAQSDYSDAAVAISKADGLPSIDSSVSYTEMLAGGDRGSSGLQVQTAVNVPIYQGGTVRNYVKAAEARSTASRALAADVETNVFIAAVAAYVDVLRDRKIVALNRENVATLTTTLQGVSSRLAVHDLTRTDLAQAQARLAIARGQLEHAEAALITSESEYHRVTGTKPTALATPPALRDMPADVDDAIDSALKNNPRLRAARTIAEASGLELDAARGELRPRVFATINSNYNDTPMPNSIGNREKFGASAGISLRLSLFQGGRKTASVRRASSRNVQSEQSAIDIERAVASGTRAAFADWRAAVAMVQASEMAVTSSRQALSGVRMENSVGSRTVLDILNAEQELRDAQSQLARAERDSYVAGFQVIAAMGLAQAKFLNLAPEPLIQSPPAGEAAARLDPQPMANAGLVAATPSPSAVELQPLPLPASPPAAAHPKVQLQAPTVPTVARPPVPALTTTGRWVVQLGAFANLPAAMRRWQAVQAEARKLPQHPAGSIVRRSVNGNVFLRPMLNGFSDWDAAQQACSSLTARNLGPCLVRRPDIDATIEWTESTTTRVREQKP